MGGGVFEEFPSPPPKKTQKCKYWKLPSDQNLITQQVTNNPLYKGHLERTWFGNSVLSWISPFRWERNPRRPPRPHAALRSPRKAHWNLVVHHPQVKTLVCPVGSWVQKNSGRLLFVGLLGCFCWILCFFGKNDLY